MDYAELAQRKNIMLCYPFEEKRLGNSEPFRNSWDQWPVFVQPKLDGERCRVVTKPNGIFMLSSSEEIFLHLPELHKELLDFAAQVGELPELDGELYRHGWPFEKIHSVVSTNRVTTHPEHNQITYNIFDLINDESQVFRLLGVKQLLANERPFWSHIRKVQTYKCESIEQVWGYLELFIKNGYEGIIIRHPEGLYKRTRSTDIMKFKPAQHDEFRIVDVLEEHDLDGNPKGRLGRLVLDSKDGETTFKVYSGFTDEERVAYWQMRDRLRSGECIAKIEYQNITGKNKVPRSGRFSSDNKLKVVIDDINIHDKD